MEIWARRSTAGGAIAYPQSHAPAGLTPSGVSGSISVALGVAGMAVGEPNFDNYSYVNVGDENESQGSGGSFSITETSDPRKRGAANHGPIFDMPTLPESLGMPAYGGYLDLSGGLVNVTKIDFSTDLPSATGLPAYDSIPGFPVEIDLAASRASSGWFVMDSERILALAGISASGIVIDFSGQKDGSDIRIEIPGYTIAGIDAIEINKDCNDLLFQVLKLGLGSPEKPPEIYPNERGYNRYPGVPNPPGEEIWKGKIPLLRGQGSLFLELKPDISLDDWDLDFKVKKFGIGGKLEW